MTGIPFTIQFNNELLVNGNFDSGDNWTNLQNVTIAAGIADFTSTPNDLRQEGVAIEDGKTYRVLVQVSGGTYNGLGLGIQLGGNSTVGRIDSDGVSAISVTANGTNNRFRLRSMGGDTFTGIIQNISLREIL